MGDIDLFALWQERGGEWSRILDRLEPSMIRLRNYIAEQVRPTPVTLAPCPWEVPGFALRWAEKQGWQRSLRVEVEPEKAEGQHELIVRASVWYDRESPEEGRVRKGYGAVLDYVFWGKSTEPTVTEHQLGPRLELAFKKSTEWTPTNDYRLPTA